MARTRPAALLIFAITATGIMTNTLVSPALPDIIDGLGAPRGAAGLVIGAATLPGIFLAPVVGALADRWGRRLVLVPCLAVFGVTGGLCATAGSIEALTALRLAQGISSAGLVSLSVVLIGDHWEGTERASMVGRNAAVLTVCLAVFPLIGGALADIGWRWTFAPYTLALLTAALLWRRLPRERPSSGVRVVSQLARTLPALRSRQLVGVLVGALLIFAVIFGLLLTVLPVYLEEQFGLSATMRGLVLGVPALGNTAAALSLGRLRRRWHYRVVLLAGTALLGSGMLGVAAVSTTGGIVAAITVSGLGQGLLVPTLQERATSAGTVETRGTVVASLVSVSRLGQTVGPVGAAWLAAGPGGPPAAFAAGAGVAVAMAVTFVAMGRGREGDAD